MHDCGGAVSGRRETLGIKGERSLFKKRGGEFFSQAAVARGDGGRPSSDTGTPGPLGVHMLLRENGERVGAHGIG